MTEVVPAPTQAVQSLYTALQTGDADAITGLLSPDFVGVTTAGLPLGLGGTYYGPRSMTEDFWWRLGRTFRARAIPETFAQSGSDRLLVTGTYRGTCRPTGRDFEAAFVHTWTFDADGRIGALSQLTDTAAWHAALQGSARASAASYPGETIDDLETIAYDVADGVASVILDRPERRNAIDARMADETLVVARAIAADPSVRAVLIAGNGPSLTVGGDIDHFLTATPGTIGSVAARMTTTFHEAFRVLGRIDAPIVTAAHGSVAGGGLGFLYAADVVFASTDALFCTAFSGIGLSGDGGGTWHLPRMIGALRARRMYVENLRVDATTAEQWGLVSEVVASEELRNRALTTARRLATGPTKGFGHQRRLLRESWSRSLSEQLTAETEAIEVTGNSHDAQQAVTAFVAKTPPEFEGR